MTSILLACFAILIALPLGCGSDSSAAEPEPICFDSGPLPLGESIPSVDAECSLPATSAVVTDAHAQSGALSGLGSDSAITIVTCGTGTPIPSDRAQSCTAILVDGLFLLFDAGDGAQRSLERLQLPVAEIDAMFLTHFHSDHIADVGEVISRSWILGRTTPLTVYGGESVQRVVDGFNGVYALDDNYRVAHHGEDILTADVGRAEAHTIADPGAGGRVVFERDGVAVTAFTVNHPPIEPALGYRVDYAGRSVVISGDTTATASLLEMSRDADVLVAEVMNEELLETLECALRGGGMERNATLLRDIRTYHIGTRALGELAAEAGVGMVVLTHLVPGFDNDDPRAETLFGDEVAEVFSGEVVTARDGTTVTIE